jgi:NAD(P)-dependent dehydrogenase (short-subunit alcohol dehydrogenase family)
MSQPSKPVTIVTGGSRGIGAAIALRLASAGHDLVLSYADNLLAAERTAEAVAEHDVRCVAVRADVASEEDVSRLFGAAGKMGQVTGLVNNAGLTAHIGPLADTPEDVIRRVIDVNLLGAVLCARRAAQVMSTTRGGQGGVIVNISSAAATTGSPGEYVHYAAAKAGVDSLTVGLAKELAPDGIWVNAVSPGTIDTEIHAAAGAPDRAARAGSKIPLGRAGEADEVAAAVAWLFGPDAGYVSGAVLRVTGAL